MALLAQPKRKAKYGFDPRNTNWSQDDSKVGQKLMEKMGWSKGKGLGANEDGMTEHIKASYKWDTAGLGNKGQDGDAWTAHLDDFNDLLKQLNAESGNDTPATQTKTNAEETADGQKRYYGRFARGRVKTLRSTEDLDCIFGRRKAGSENSTPMNQSAANSDDDSDSKGEKDSEQEEAKEGREEKSHGLVTVTSTSSVQEYFAKKMAEIKSRKGKKGMQREGGDEGEKTPSGTKSKGSRNSPQEEVPKYGALGFSYDYENGGDVEGKTAMSGPGACEGSVERDESCRGWYPDDWQGTRKNVSNATEDSGSKKNKKKRKKNKEDEEGENVEFVKEEEVVVNSGSKKAEGSRKRKAKDMTSDVSNLSGENRLDQDEGEEGIGKKKKKKKDRPAEEVTKEVEIQDEKEEKVKGGSKKTRDSRKINNAKDSLTDSGNLVEDSRPGAEIEEENRKKKKKAIESADEVLVQKECVKMTEDGTTAGENEDEAVAEKKGRRKKRSKEETDTVTGKEGVTDDVSKSGKKRKGAKDRTDESSGKQTADEVLEESHVTTNRSRKKKGKKEGRDDDAGGVEDDKVNQERKGSGKRETNVERIQEREEGDDRPERKKRKKEKKKKKDEPSDSRDEESTSGNGRELSEESVGTRDAGSCAQSTKSGNLLTTDQQSGAAAAANKDGRKKKAKKGKNKEERPSSSQGQHEENDATVEPEGKPKKKRKGKKDSQAKDKKRYEIFPGANLSEVLGYAMTKEIVATTKQNLETVFSEMLKRKEVKRRARAENLKRTS